MRQCHPKFLVWQGVTPSSGERSDPGLHHVVLRAGFDRKKLALVLLVMRVVRMALACPLPVI